MDKDRGDRRIANNECEKHTLTCLIDILHTNFQEYHNTVDFSYISYLKKKNTVGPYPLFNNLNRQEELATLAFY